MTIGRIFWAGLFAGLFAARLKRNNRKYPDRSPLFRGGKAAFDLGAAALLLAILGFFLEVDTFIGAVATALVVGEVLRVAGELQIKRGNRLPISANALVPFSEWPTILPRGTSAVSRKL